MADLKKFEEMLDRLVNEDKEGAEELFHEIVVEKSREIYESLLETDLEEDDDEVEEAADEEVEESDDDLDEAADEEVEESDDDEEMSEDFDLDEFEVEADPMGGDAADNMMAAMDDEPEMDMDDEGDDEGDDDMENRVDDLEDALDDLKAEFEKMMAGDDDMDDEADMNDEGDDEEAEEESFAFEDEEVEEAAAEEIEEGATKKAMMADAEKMSKAAFCKKYGDENKGTWEACNETKTAGEQMREYVEKVNGGGLDAAKIGGDNGANTKSAVAGKNDMGGTASNLNQANTEDGAVEAGKGALKGAALSDTSAKEDNAGNVNVPGAKGATKMNSTKGHGAEKKGAGETADNKKSTVGK